jgi:predicted esterase
LNNEPDSALTWLEKSIDMGAYVFADDEDFKSLQGSPKFEELKIAADKKIRAIKDRQLLPVIALPDNYSPLQQWPVVIALHGFGANPVDFGRSLKDPVTRNGYILVCPYGVEIRGTTSFGWGEDAIMVGEKIKDIINWTNNSLNIDTARVILLGYSQGGWFSYFIGLNNPEIYEGVIAVAGYFPDEADSLLENVEKTDIRFYAMIGEQDRSFQNNLKAGNVLGKRNIAFKVQSYPDLGHAFPPDADQEISKALEWIESE